MKLIILLISVTIGIAVAGHHGDGGHDNAHYKFEYGVHDPHTHDHKSQHEHRDGKHVTGGYTLKEADGTHRIVKYKSGPHKGFEAVVERVGYAQHPAHYGKHGKHGHGGKGGISYVGVTHWSNQGSDGHGHEDGGHGNGGHVEGGHGDSGYGHSEHGKQGGHGGQGGLGGYGHGGQGGFGGYGHGGQGGYGHGGQGGHGGHGHGTQGEHGGHGHGY